MTYLWKLGAMGALLLLVAALVGGCGDAEVKPPAKKVVLKVSVLQSGDILVDGVEVDLEELDARFAGIKRAGGAVWLYRELKQGTPPASTMRILNLTIKHAVITRTTSQPDFSDLAGK
jgi:hypothetical protein